MTERLGKRRALLGVGILDVACAVVVVAVAQLEQWGPMHGSGFSQRAGPLWALEATVWVCAGVLLFRRRAPVAVVAAVSLALSIEWLAYGASDGLSLLLPQVLALYAVGRYAAPRHFWAAVAVTAPAVAIHEWRDPRYSFDGRAVTAWAMILGVGLIGWILATRARQLHDVVDRATRLEEEREQRAAAAVALERERIARELHDLVGHGISLMVLQLVAAQGNLEHNQIEPARDRLAQLETTARTTLAEMRRLVTVMDGEAPLCPQPGIGDIAALVEETRNGGLAVELEMGDAVEASPGVGLAAYRVVQEALTNVIKHAHPDGPTRVVVAVHRDTLVVEVADSGPGPVGRLDGGMGIAGMRERVALYGGDLDVGPCDGGGFHVCARFPLEEHSS